MAKSFREMVMTMDDSNILSKETYEEIVYFINNLQGQQIWYEFHLRNRFPEIEHRTLLGILSNTSTQRNKELYHRNWQQKLMKRYQQLSQTNDSTIILKLAEETKLSPAIICRFILLEKYTKSKRSVTEMLKRPETIPDKKLAATVLVSIFADNSEGPIIDFVRRSIGEEYEVILKELARSVGMVFSDETDLRLSGYDKTPDLKLALPCLYKGVVINWIESKALFGDVKTHKKYITKQLSSYCNRFGSGMVIYWFGYVKDILYLKENGNNIVIMNKFPEREHFEFLKI